MEAQSSHQTANLTTNLTTNLGEICTLNPKNEVQIQYYKNPMILNQQYTHDIIPGVYEGGFQLWQCEVEMIKKMFELPEFKDLISGKNVIEIGCGHGLLGIAADKLGAQKVILQDYNQDVIEQLTKLTVNLNNVSSHVDFISGDWEQIVLAEKVDIILGSQVTYREQNYQKIITFIVNNMKPTGKCILANKSYYFGVGGNLASFKQILELKGLRWNSVAKIVPKSGGNKKQILEIFFNQTQ